MRMQRARVLLDRSGDAVAPVGYQVIRTEMEFLQHVLDRGPLLVRGHRLCDWAEEFCRGRGENVVAVGSPISELQETCPSLSKAQAASVVDGLGERFLTLSRPLSIEMVLPALHPVGPWYEPPSPEHAARWLLWLDEQGPMEHLEPLLAMKAAEWRVGLEDAYADAYEACGHAQAGDMLRRWFGIGHADAARPLGAFHAPVPERWHKVAHDAWAARLVGGEAGLFERLLGQGISPELLETAANVCASYYQHNRARLTLGSIGMLSPYLPHEVSSNLRKLCQPPSPPTAPSGIAEALGWFVQDYLPYRQWEADHGDANAHDLVQSRARQFADWYLCVYPTALAGGNGQEHLAISRSGSLRVSRGKWVTLWVILDGLHYADSMALAGLIRREPRLSLAKLDAVFSSLPTTTRFCKPALMNGVPACMTPSEQPIPEFEGARPLPEGRDPAEAMQDAHPGDVFVWSLLEPDRTYHKPSDRATIVAGVEGQLKTVASRVISAARAIPRRLPVRVIISSDHGRLMSSAIRNTAIPPGMEAHGRAAWGPCGMEFGASGLVVDEEQGIAYLHAARFELPQDCAVMLGSSAFVTSDGRTGTEQFPHGGLYPEEVLTPWLEFIRDLDTPAISITLRGKARANTRGAMVIHLENPSEMRVVVKRVCVRSAAGAPLELNITCLVGPMASREVGAEVNEWPSGTFLGAARAWATCELPGGTTFQCEVTNELASEDFSRESPVDLDGLGGW